MMKFRSMLTATLCMVVALATGQSTTWLVHDLATQTIDSITHFTIAPGLQSAHTEFYVGEHHETFAPLPETTPTENLYPNSEFTKQRPAGLDYDLTDFPIRTTAKGFYIENDTLKHLCSGSMISRRHVLTAAHCLSNPFSEARNTLNYDSLQVCLVYDNGAVNLDFGCSSVRKVYRIKDWKLAGEDLAILELADSLGAQSGWVGIGFAEDEAVFENDVFYKFTYPFAALPAMSSRAFNGDTLYYNYGRISLVDSNYVGVYGARGAPGESGSSILRVEYGQEYTSYGVLNWSNSIRHTRFTARTFQLIQQLIADEQVVNTTEGGAPSVVKLFPNPTHGPLSLSGLPAAEPTTISLYDGMGRLLWMDTKTGTSYQKDVSALPSGCYYLSCKMGDEEKVIPLIKE